VTPAGRPVAEHTVAAERVCAAELAAALSLSERAAANRVALAQDLDRLPGTRSALTTGRLHLYTARMVVDHLRPLEDESASAIEAKVLPRYAGRSYGDLSRALRRAVLAADPAAAEKRKARGVEDRTVEACSLPDGMASLTMSGPAEDVEAMFTFTTGSAEAATAPGDPRTLAQRRFDVLADLAHSGLGHDTTRPDLLAHQGGVPGTRLKTRQGRRPTIQVTVSIETLLGLRDDPGELAGYGPITADTARRIASEGTWRRLLTDPRTGRFDELSVDTYEPPQDIRDHVIARDPVCIGIGCRLPWNRCDLDHRVPHPRGPTSAGNLEPWCRTGHQIKTFTDTEVVDDPTRDGGRLVTYPSGRSYPLPADPVLEDFDLHDTPPF
jgi:5-methylcytosine-specific restriction endonuclease McrA